jgi:hypothetical protein
MMLRFPLMDADRVAVGIGNHRHLAGGRGKWFHFEFHAIRFQMRDGLVEIFHFQADGAAVTAWMPVGRTRADGERAGGDVVFRPLHPAGFADGHGGLQAQHAFVKVSRPRHVGDGVATECDFGDFEHNQTGVFKFISRETQLFSEAETRRDQTNPGDLPKRNGVREKQPPSANWNRRRAD